MKLLLDTHAFLWYLSGDSRLSRRARQNIENTETELFISAASVWEMAIKSNLGRLVLPCKLDQFIAEKVSGGFNIISIDWEHAARVETLPMHHRDPFDRLIIAQAISENISIITSDAAFHLYPIKIVW